MSIFNNKFLRRASLLSLSQIVSILVSAFLILVIPKFISVSDYGFWQLFVLYSGYVGLFHFGYSDGLYISYGGKNIDSIGNLRVQFFLFLLSQIFFTVLCCIVALVLYSDDSNRLFIFISLAIFLLIENYYKLISFVLLATARTEDYAKSVLFDKCFTFVFLAILLFSKQLDLTLLILTFVICRLLALIILIKDYRQLLPSVSFEHLNINISTIIKQCKLGIVLTFSNIVGTLIMASGRLVVENVWSIDVFAKISLAVSLSFFILSFVSQISLVLFPVLCNADQTLQKKIFLNGSFSLSLIIMFSFILYFVIIFFIGHYLPLYKDSTSFFIYLFPLVLFETKAQILYITYCKSLNKLKLLLNVNILTLFLSAFLYYIAARIHSLDFILIAMLGSLAFRSILLNLVLVKHYNLSFDVMIIVDVLVSIIFIWLNKSFELHYVIGIYLSILLLIFLLFCNRVKSVFSSLIKK